MTKAANVYVAYWHFSEVMNEASDFRFGGQSRLNASVARALRQTPDLSSGSTDRRKHSNELRLLQARGGNTAITSTSSRNPSRASRPTCTARRRRRSVLAHVAIAHLTK